MSPSRTERRKAITIRIRTQASLRTSLSSRGYSFDELEKIHARVITTDMGWKIIIDRGLDIHAKHNFKDIFSVQNTLQEAGKNSTFEMAIIKI